MSVLVKAPGTNRYIKTQLQKLPFLHAFAQYKAASIVVDAGHCGMPRAEQAHVPGTSTASSTARSRIVSQSPNSGTQMRCDIFCSW